MSALAAAATLAELSGWTLTNLQLQKLLYLAQMFHLGETGEAMFPEDFEAWKLGPVQPQVYSRAKMYGARPIENLFTPDRVTEPTAREVLSRIHRDLGGLPGWKLVEITHWGKGAWAANYDGHDRGSTISKSDILAEYRERFQRAVERRAAANGSAAVAG